MTEISPKISDLQKMSHLLAVYMYVYCNFNLVPSFKEIT